MSEEKSAEILKQEEDLALRQLCVDRHFSSIANEVENWKILHQHNCTVNMEFDEFTTDELINLKQQQFKFLQLWKRVNEDKATYYNLCENFRIAQNIKAELHTRSLSISSLKDFIKGIINSNLKLFVNELNVEAVLVPMKDEGLLSDDEIEMIEDTSNEEKKCKQICYVLKHTGVIHFQKFILLLSNNNLHAAIVNKIKEDFEKNEIYHFLPTSECKSSDASCTLHSSFQSPDKPHASRKRKRIDYDQYYSKRVPTVEVESYQQSKYFRISEVSVQFNELLDKLMDCLQHCEVPRLITKFNAFMADNAKKITFFPQKLLFELHKCKTVKELFLILTPHFSWHHLHVLQLVVDASKCEKAKKLLSDFKSKIDKSHSVMEYDFSQPSSRIIPAENSSEALVCAKSSRDNMSLQDSIEVTKAVADSSAVEEHSIETTATQKGSIILYWLVIRGVIGLIIDGIRNNLTRFYKMGIIEVCIDPNIVITTVPGMRVRSLSYLMGPPTEIQELSTAISKLHLDLLTNYEPQVQLGRVSLSFKQKVEDLQKKCHMLSENADTQFGDLMSLKDEFTTLKESKKAADEEAKLKLSQMQSDSDEMESRLSIVEARHSSLKSENKNLISRIASVKQHESEMVLQLQKANEKLSGVELENKDLIGRIAKTRQQEAQKDLEIQKANESISTLVNEVIKLKEEKLSRGKEGVATTSHPLPVEDPKEYTFKWTSTLITGYENVQFGRPDAIAVGPDHELLICDYKHQCVFVLDNELNLLKILGTSGDGRLTHPNGIAVDQDGIIAVSDYRFHQVKKFSLADGTCMCSIGSPGQEDGNFDYPRGLAFSSDGFLYVMDWGNSRIQVFNKQNEFAFKFGSRGLGPSEFDHPTRIAMDGLDNVYVANYNSSSIGIFSNLGKFITSIPTNKPFSVAVTTKGYIFADDNDKNLIRLWNPSHQLIGEYGKQGDQKGEFNSITDMVIGKNGLYVVDAKNKRLQLVEGIDIW